MTNVRLQSEGLNTSERASLYDDNAPEHAIGTMRYPSSQKYTPSVMALRGVFHGVRAG
jgi:hypothetical protein